MRFHSLDQWLNWQETLHPSEIDLGLERVAKVLRRLQLDKPVFRVVTVAGTNGKGSSVAILEAILLKAGYRVGCYTSPHLLRYNERIHINGLEVNDRALCESFERIDQARGEISLTYFEFGTLAAIDIFQQAQIDIAILEVGLGGRLDAVNVLDADVALITAIDIDHEKWLGSDRETIGREKAGILRPARPAVCIDANPPCSLLAYAAQLGTSLYLLGRDFQVMAAAEGMCWQGPDRQSMDLPRPALPGAFQLANAAGVLMVLHLLAKEFPVEPGAMAAGLNTVRLAGRFHVLSDTPQVILDVAHNPQSVRVLVETLSVMPCAGQTRVVLAMLADKDITLVVRTLAKVANAWYLATLPVARAAPVQRLLDTVGDSRSKSFNYVSEAFAAACNDAAAQDRIVVTGSFYTVAAILAQTV